MMSMSLSNIAISNIESVDYRCIISGISKSEAINLMQNIDLNEKRGIKMGQEILTFWDIEIQKKNFFFFIALRFLFFKILILRKY